MTWESSSSHCASQNSHLAVCEEEEELTFLIEEGRTYLTFWIGLRRDTQDNWKWVSEQPFTQGKWGLSGEGRCVCLAKQSMQVKPCETDQLWVCEKRAPLCD
ncbi:early activation antigen CD69-like isoform X2 [Erpetoichthys calabaricus]|uniref:early activation antigen CD69-like isoform X1 n=1 Tax=Erpetoichthys calabaricus TaxID=27687 RepID=UPI00223447E7|nr:early activation antigen CD69-like isoform X1 [Erpetoichthys calabaricus]XP_051790695.1 early activation antigen CD69-like isoform X2 [Erpetoichthys calabaricus]